MTPRYPSVILAGGDKPVNRTTPSFFFYFTPHPAHTTTHTHTHAQTTQTRLP